MVSISSTGFFLAFQPFTPHSKTLPPTKIPALPWCLAKVLPTAPRWEPNACSVHNWENKIPPERPHNFPKSKDSPNKKLCSWRKPKTGPELFFRSAQTDRYTEGLSNKPSDCHVTWDSLHLGDPPSVPCRAVRMVTSHPKKKQLLLSNTQIFWPKKRTTEALGHHLNWLLPWNMFFSTSLKWPKKNILQNPTTDLFDLPGPSQLVCSCGICVNLQNVHREKKNPDAKQRSVKIGHILYW